jgi:glutamate-5-semialdehyde dehydrogenase
MSLIKELGKNARIATSTISAASTKQKNDALSFIAKNINKYRDEIIKANKIDSTNGKNNNLTDALLDRLMLNNERIDGIITSLEQIIALRDPVGEINDLEYQASGIQVGKMRVPLGVVGIIYESRPNVTIDAAALCLKSGNATILRGGKEAINSNLALHKNIAKGLDEAGLDVGSVQLLTNTARELVGELVSSPEVVDVIIPRGGKGLVAAISDSAKVPVIKHLDGICHTYLDKFADNNKAIDIAYNAKTRRYGVCNATETLLIHQDFDKSATLELIEKYLQKGVELRGCDKAKTLHSAIKDVSEDDWSTEYLDAILSIKIVSSLDDAINHINTYSSGHTESIVSQDFSRVREFLTKVDSSSIMANASTAFADGFEYGLGAEIGISTDKFHVRGPVGLEGLTSQKYIVLGDGHTRP